MVTLLINNIYLNFRLAMLRAIVPRVAQMIVNATTATRLGTSPAIALMAPQAHLALAALATLVERKVRCHRA